MPPKRRGGLLHRRHTPAPRRGRRRQRQRLAAGGLDLLGGRVDGAGQLLMRLGGLGGDGDVGAVARGVQRDGEADAAAERR